MKGTVKISLEDYEDLKAVAEYCGKIRDDLTSCVTTRVDDEDEEFINWGDSYINVVDLEKLKPVLIAYVRKLGVEGRFSKNNKFEFINIE